LTRAVEFLVSRGHKLHDVLWVYTFDQVIAFSDAANANTYTRLGDMAVAFRTAQHAKDQEFEKYLNKLQSVNQKSERDPTPEEIAEFRQSLTGRLLKPGQVQEQGHKPRR